MRRVVIAPADMQAHALPRDALDTLVDRGDVEFELLEKLGLRQMAEETVEKTSQRVQSSIRDIGIIARELLKGSRSEEVSLKF